jgi:hypothetical protein
LPEAGFKHIYTRRSRRKEWKEKKLHKQELARKDRHRLVDGFKHIYTRRSRRKEWKEKKLHKQELARKDRHRLAEVTLTRSEGRNKRRAESVWLLRRRRAAISQC